MNVFVVEAEHPTVPGLVRRVHASKAGAIASAVDLVQAILTDTIKTYPHLGRACPSNHWNNGEDICADCGADLQAEDSSPIPLSATAENWQQIAEAMENIHGAAHCYVNLIEEPVLA